MMQAGGDHEAGYEARREKHTACPFDSGWMSRNAKSLSLSASLKDGDVAFDDLAEDA